MKKKTALQAALVVVFLAALPVLGNAGEVRTKDRPKECGGYHGGHYHMKCEGEKKGFVNKEQGWQNPFSGFTKSGGKPKKQGEMPHSK